MPKEVIYVKYLWPQIVLSLLTQEIIFGLVIRPNFTEIPRLFSNISSNPSNNTVLPVVTKLSTSPQGTSFSTAALIVWQINFAFGVNISETDLWFIGL